MPTRLHRQQSALVLSVREGKIAYERPYQRHATALKERLTRRLVRQLERLGQRVTLEPALEAR